MTILSLLPKIFMGILAIGIIIAIFVGFAILYTKLIKKKTPDIEPSQEEEITKGPETDNLLKQILFSFNEKELNQLNLCLNWENHFGSNNEMDYWVKYIKKIEAQK